MGAAADDQGALPVGVAGLDDLLAGGQPAGIAARSGEPVVGGHQLVDLAGDLDAGAGQHDQVVA
jgi:hypothetical protein